MKAFSSSAATDAVNCVSRRPDRASCFTTGAIAAVPIAGLNDRSARGAELSVLKGYVPASLAITPGPGKVRSKASFSVAGAVRRDTYREAAKIHQREIKSSGLWAGFSLGGRCIIKLYNNTPPQ
jgi:hypothetical protein